MGLLSIKSDVGDLVKQYKTIDPFILISRLGIGYLETPFDMDTLGVTVTSDDHSTITLNQNILTFQKPFIAAHELGHVIEHKGESTTFFREQCFGCNIPRIEAEANKFAFNLLLFELNDNEVEYNKYDIVRQLEFPDSMASYI